MHIKDKGPLAVKAAPNAICVGGPCDGMLTRIHQDVGIVQVPFGPAGDRADIPYRITSDRLHHPSNAIPFTVLTWADATE